MKKICIMLAVLLTALTAAAADSLWHENYTKALELAKEQNKPLLINFTGSDWCGFCIILDKEVFSQQAFQSFAKKNLVLFKADFPRDDSGQLAATRKQNRELAKKYGVRGYPTVLILSPEGKELGRTSGYRKGSAKEYLKNLKKIINKP